MKSVKVKVTVLMLAIMMIFTGCYSEEVSLKINSDGSGTVSTVENLSVSEYKALCEKEMKNEGMTDAEIAEAITEIDSNMKSSGYEIVTIDGEEYYHSETSVNLDSGSLASEFIGLDENAYVTEDTFYVNADLTEVLSSYKEMGYTVDASTVNFTITVEFPKKIVNTNGKLDVSNTKKVTFTVPLNTSKTLFATTNSSVTEDSVKDAIKASNSIKKPKIRKLKAGKVSKKAKKATVKLKIKKVKGAKNYYVEWSLKKNFNKAKHATFKKTSYTIKNLKKGKKYYVRVRAQKENLSGLTVESKWAKKTVKTKK